MPFTTSSGAGQTASAASDIASDVKTDSGADDDAPDAAGTEVAGDFIRAPPASTGWNAPIPPGRSTAVTARTFTGEDQTPAPPASKHTATGNRSSFSPPAGFADRVAVTCYSQFARLPRKTRPQAGREWALLAGVLLSEPPHTNPEVVSLGTGSKCLGASQLSATGEVLADSHAEVVARRAFRRFLMAEVRRVLAGSEESRWLVKCDGGAALREDVRVHFFTSHTPCGDCSIFPRESVEEAEAGDEPEAKKARRDGEDRGTTSDVSNGASLADAGDVALAPADTRDIYRTGAKPVVGEAADPLRPGAGYHVTGVLRTKPGRGERTLSMSCSDKLARWLRLGLQGALLSLWIPAPLTLSSVVTGPCPYNERAMRRALLDRPGLIAQPALLQATPEFEFSRRVVERGAGEGVRTVPSPCSVVWSGGCPRGLEVSVEGVRQGVTKKARGTPAARVAICRRELMQEFVQLAKDVATEQLPAELRAVESDLDRFSYREMKDLAGDYVARWERLKHDDFRNWTEKPSHLKDFRITTATNGTGGS